MSAVWVLPYKNLNSKENEQMKSHVKKRNAFTLVELLVVIAIIGLLSGLLLPAVQQAREVAKRSRCQSNLKEIALGIHNFSTTYGYLPQAHRPPGPTTSARLAAFTELLPFLEQANLYNSYNLSLNWSSPANAAAVQSVVPVLICPSAPNSSRLDGDPNPSSTPGGWYPNVAAVTDYSPINGVDARLSAAGLVAAAGDGILTRDTYTGSGLPTAANHSSGPPRLSDVTDGLSNTILLAESAGRPIRYVKGGVRVTADTDLFQKNPPPGANVINGGGWSRPATELTIRGAYDNGATWTGSGPAATDVLYAVNRTNGGPYDFTTGNADPTYGSLGSGEVFAFHPGGANVALGDGSVRLINQSISFAVFAALATRAGGEATQVDANQ